MKELTDFLERIPGIQKPIGSRTFENGIWWVKFPIDIHSEIGWNVVQELGHVVNYLSVEQRLPTIFYPVSPPPNLNGGPENFLSWIIETRDKDFKPETLKGWLEGRLPNPVDDIEQWRTEETFH